MGSDSLSIILLWEPWDGCFIFMTVELQTFSSRCPPNISTWMFKGISDSSKQNFWFSPQILFQLQSPLNSSLFLLAAQVKSLGSHGWLLYSPYPYAQFVKKFRRLYFRNVTWCVCPSPHLSCHPSCLSLRLLQCLLGFHSRPSVIYSHQCLEDLF